MWKGKGMFGLEVRPSGGPGDGLVKSSEDVWVRERNVLIFGVVRRSYCNRLDDSIVIDHR